MLGEDKFRLSDSGWWWW